MIGGLRYYLDDNNFNDVLHESVITAADQYIKRSPTWPHSYIHPLAQRRGAWGGAKSPQKCSQFVPMYISILHRISKGINL